MAIEEKNDARARGSSTASDNGLNVVRMQQAETQQRRQIADIAEVGFQQNHEFEKTRQKYTTDLVKTTILSYRDTNAEVAGKVDKIENYFKEIHRIVAASVDIRQRKGEISAEDATKERFRYQAERYANTYVGLKRLQDDLERGR
jgi:hypothetical protein